jgi:hypothetical protein
VPSCAVLKKVFKKNCLISGPDKAYRHNFHTAHLILSQSGLDYKSEAVPKPGQYKGLDFTRQEVIDN